MSRATQDHGEPVRGVRRSRRLRVVHQLIARSLMDPRRHRRGIGAVGVARADSCRPDRGPAARPVTGMRFSPVTGAGIGVETAGAVWAGAAGAGEGVGGGGRVGTRCYLRVQAAGSGRRIAALMTRVCIFGVRTRKCRTVGPPARVAATGEATSTTSPYGLAVGAARPNGLTGIMGLTAMDGACGGSLTDSVGDGTQPVGEGAVAFASVRERVFVGHRRTPCWRRKASASTDRRGGDGCRVPSTGAAFGSTAGEHHTAGKRAVRKAGTCRDGGVAPRHDTFRAVERRTSTGRGVPVVGAVWPRPDFNLGATRPTSGTGR